MCRWFISPHRYSTNDSIWLVKIWLPRIQRINNPDLRMIQLEKSIFDTCQQRIAQRDQPRPQTDTLFSWPIGSSTLKVGGIYYRSIPYPWLSHPHLRSSYGRLMFTKLWVHSKYEDHQARPTKSAVVPIPQSNYLVLGRSTIARLLPINLR